jgi:hypothetical protein
VVLLNGVGPQAREGLRHAREGGAVEGRGLHHPRRDRAGGGVGGGGEQGRAGAGPVELDRPLPPAVQHSTEGVPMWLETAIAVP